MLTANTLTTDIKQIIIQSRETAIRSVDFHRVLMYWHIGKRIFEEEQQGQDRADYGAYLIKSLAQQLQPEFGSGFSARQLERYRQFYRAFPIASALRTQLNWTQYRMLLRLDDALDIESLVNDFKYKEDIEIYNEFSFQHELGIFLREKLNDKGYKIQFERNVKDFGYMPKDKNEKKEIDIVILNKYDKYAIELKFANTTNGQYPEKMFSFIKDIHFMETVKAECEGFVRNYCITIVEDENFYKKKGKIDGIYAYFRNGKQITGDIEKPTGKEKYSISLKKTYQIIWQKFGKNKKFYIVEIS